MKVPESWWPGYDGDELCPGRISAVDFDDEHGRFFHLELDDGDGPYRMRYDAVLNYADEEHPTFNSFQLPSHLLSDPEDEEVTLSQLLRQRSFANRSSHQSISRNLNSDDESDADTAATEPSTCPSSDDDINGADNETITEYESEDDTPSNSTVFRRTNPSDWKKIGPRHQPRAINPVPFTGTSQEFSPKITAEELASMTDASGDIRFESVFEWMLPRFGDAQQNYFDFVATRMRNYMLYIMHAKEFKPKYFKPSKELTIQAHHVARFYGVHMARMIRGFPSIEETWSSRESLDHVGAAAECMPKDAYIDMYRCMHFSDDWELNEDGSGETYWEDIFEDERFEPSPDVERHRWKYEHIEDGYNRRWKEVVSFGRWLTADESRVAGWYRSGITIGPEPKPIRTGATVHSICVTHGQLRTFKVHCRVYGGKHDEGLKHCHENTATTQKWVNLYNDMLEAFKGFGMCCTLDSAYMGDILGQIARDVWGINLVGTCQTDRTGAGKAAKIDKKSMKKGTYESILYQHRVKALCYAMWADNNIVKTLSNFHSPEILAVGAGVLRRRRVDGQREQHQTEVSCPRQQKDYSETFHLIDKGNGKESKYDMGGQTKGHNWAPKLVMRYWNFGLGNAHTYYVALVKEHTPFRRYLTMSECVKILAHYLMQYGPPMRKREAEHPKYSRDLQQIMDFGTGRKLRTDAKGEVAIPPTLTQARYAIAAPQQRLRELRVKQKKSKWRIHQSFAREKQGRCCWKECPGLKEEGSRKRKRSCATFMYCEECIAREGKDIYLCNGIKKHKAVLCHLAYHKKYHDMKYSEE
jgi:hypothetical protein